MPINPAEGERVFQHYQANNGRYYLIADVLLKDNRLLQEVIFEGDSLVAVEYQRQPICKQPEQIGRQVKGWLAVKDHSSGHRYGEATEDERRQFRTAI